MPVSVFLRVVQTKIITTIMKTCIQTLTIAACALAFAGNVRADDSVAGTWKGQFDSQIGQQKYTYVFKVDGTNVTGTATGEREMGTNTVAITEGTVSTNGIFFVEPLKFQDNELRIEYTGTVNGDEIKFHRKVGDVAEEDFVAHRIRGVSVISGMKRAPMADTNTPPTKP
ncbi:MAG: hypothetical protein ACREDQ_05805 [Limisphaerales bacterium]